MKKFLRIVSTEKTEVPAAVEERILAAAALRAHGFRRRRQFLKFGLPAAAALALMTSLTFFSYTPQPRPNLQKTEVAGTDLLGLADMTVVDEGNFLLAAMSELEPADESFSI